MLSPFSFATASQIHFGCGVADRLAPLTRELGQRVLLVCGSAPERVQAQVAALEQRGLVVEVTSVTGEPTAEDARAAVERARGFGAEVLVGLGGGSALDLAKATAGLLGSGGDPLDYLEVVGRGQPLTRPALPWIAVPTTAGTGAEVTKNAVLSAEEQGVKVSLRSDFLLPRHALIDPLLTLSVPPATTATTGFDALTQVIEPFLSGSANPMTDALCREGIRRGGRSLLRAVDDGSDVAAREDLALTSLFGGLALANAKLGAVHGFAGPLGGMYRAPHGALCAALLPACLEVSQQALRQRHPAAPAHARLSEVAQLLTGRPQADAAEGIFTLREMSRRAGIAGLGAYGVNKSQFAVIIPKARASSSMKGHPIELTDQELTEILDRSL